MNNYALAADSHTWWLVSAVSGGIGAVALGAILYLPSSGQPPMSNAPDAPAAGVPSRPGATHPCYMPRPPQNAGDQLPTPLCR